MNNHLEVQTKETPAALTFCRMNAPTTYFCCESIAARMKWTRPYHLSASDCPDVLVGQLGAGHRELINYCPCCGAKLVELARSVALL
jgi:hypothetical protein